MARPCPVCGGPLIQGEWHLHIGQIYADSATWTGRYPQWRAHRISKSFWAKLYVWLRDEALIRFCRRMGGHDYDFYHDRRVRCGMSWERDFDHGSLRSALKCWAVAF